MSKEQQLTPAVCQVATDDGEKDTAGKGRAKICYVKGEDIYDGDLILSETFIDIEVKIVMTPYFWKLKFDIKDLCAFDDNWGSFRKLGDAFEFMAETFTIKENMNFEVNSTTKELKISFKFVIGLKEKTLPIIIKSSDPDIATTVKSQGGYIRDLFEDCFKMTEELTKIRKELTEVRRVLREPEIVIVIMKNDGSISSTYNANFVDIPGIDEGILILKKDSTIVWNLSINGLHFLNASNCKASFRLELTAANNAKTYWPLNSGASFTLVGTAGGRYTMPFNFKDVAKLNKGKYKVKIQWAYNSGADQYVLQYNPVCGDIKLVVEIH